MDSGMKYLIEAFYKSIRGDSPVPIPYREILLTDSELWMPSLIRSVAARLRIRMASLCRTKFRWNDCLGNEIVMSGRQKDHRGFVPESGEIFTVLESEIVVHLHSILQFGPWGPLHLISFIRSTARELK